MAARKLTKNLIISKFRIKMTFKGIIIFKIRINNLKMKAIILV